MQRESVWLFGLLTILAIPSLILFTSGNFFLKLDKGLPLVYRRTFIGTLTAANVYNSCSGEVKYCPGMIRKQILIQVTQWLFTITLGLFYIKWKYFTLPQATRVQYSCPQTENYTLQVSGISKWTNEEFFIDFLEEEYPMAEFVVFFLYINRL